MRRASAWARVVVGAGLLVAATCAVAQAADRVMLTTGVVKSVDRDRRVIVLDSGWKLRIRSVIVRDQFVDLSAVRVDDTVFVSGAVIEGPDDHPSATTR